MLQEFHSFLCAFDGFEAKEREFNLIGFTLNSNMPVGEEERKGTQRRQSVTLELFIIHD